MKNIAALSITTLPGFDEQFIALLDSLYNLDAPVNVNLFTSAYNIHKTYKNFTILPLHEGKYHTGTFIVWNLLSLELALDFPNAQRIIYYQNNEIPWAKNKQVPYMAWARLFDNPHIDIIVNDPTTYDILRFTWKEPIFLEQINAETLYEIL